MVLGTSVNYNLRPLGLNGYFSSRFIVMSAQLNLFSVTAGGYKFFVNVLLDLFFPGGYLGKLSLRKQLEMVNVPN